jgi:hypothetical protein
MIVLSPNRRVAASPRRRVVTMAKMASFTQNKSLAYSYAADSFATFVIWPRTARTEWLT